MSGPPTSVLFGTYAAEERFARLSRPVVTRALWCIRDAIGCALGAHATPAAPMLTRFVAARGGRPESRVVIASGLRTASTTAAFANALLINALDYDDIHRGHLGATVIAAALALGEKRDCSGAELITAAVVGYEIGLRLAGALRYTAPRRATHGYGTWQAVASAAAAAKVLGLDARRSAHALVIAGANAPVASVMKTVYGATGPDMVKNNFGTAAEVGVTAALLAADGWEGATDLFDGETGFWRMYGAQSCDFDHLTRRLGRDYEILRVGFKAYPACRVLQSSLEAVVTACRGKLVRHADEIERIVVRAPRRACTWPFTNRRPRHMWAAQFSTPYSVAVAAAGLPPGPRWFLPQTLSDEAVLALADRVELRAHLDPKRTPGVSHATSAEAEIGLRGRIYRARISVARGEAARPMSSAQSRAKFLRLAGAILPQRRATKIWQILGRLPSLPRIGAIMRLLDPSRARSH